MPEAAAGKPKKSSLTTTIVLLIVVVVMLSGGFIGILGYIINKDAVVSLYAERGMHKAKSIAIAIDPARYSAIVENNEKDEYWHEVKAFLDRTLNETYALYVYVLLPDHSGDSLTYFAEAEVTSADVTAADFGEKDHAEAFAEEMFETIRTGRATSSGIYDGGEYGKTVAGFAAITDSAGGILGVVGVEMEAGGVLASLHHFAIVMVFAIVGFCALFSLAAILVARRVLLMPVKALANASERLAAGDMDIRLDVRSNNELGDLAADFRSLANTVNMLIGSIKMTADLHTAGEIDAVIGTSQFEGVFKEVAESINDMARDYVQLLDESISVFSKFGEGDFTVGLRRLPGKKAIVNDAVDSLKANLMAVDADITALAKAASDGDLASRIDAGKFKGDWAEMAAAMNKLLENVYSPIKETSEALKRMAAGDLDARIDKEFAGDFLMIKEALNDTAREVASYVGELKITYERLETALQEAKDANQAKSSFLSNMSHEIRTPMNAIIGMSDLLLAEEMTERQKDYVGDISASAHSLLKIINDILDMSKIESGKFELNPADYDFFALMDNLTSMFKYITQQKGIEFLFEKEGDIPQYLFGDDIRLRQVITNICGNAVKFTKKGFVRLKVTGTPTSLIFLIEDTGIGIKKEDMPKLFQSFMQVDKHRNRSVTGTGLGLTISKTFIEMMGGTIELESEYGKGTAFTVTVPKVEGDGGKVMAESSGKQAFFAPDAKVLVVDDNQFNIKVAHGLLGLHGIKPATAMSGKKAIELVQQTDFDIVFMDHMMPEMDGVETTARIRALGGKYKSLAIIALTANAVSGAKEMFLRNGFNGFISKPIDNGKLSQTLAEWLPSKIVREGQGGGADSGGAPENAPPSFMDALRDIGLDAEIGLQRFSGVESLYRDVVKDFYRSLRLYCDKMSAELRDGDYASFSIDVHTIKSSLATVGAMPLSKIALELEEASKGGNHRHCLEAYPDFCEKLLALRGRLGEIFADPSEAAAPEKAQGDPVYLSEQVKIALAAAEDFEIEPGKEAVGRLLAFDFGEQANAALEKAMAAFDDFDTIAAAKILDGI